MPQTIYFKGCPIVFDDDGFAGPWFTGGAMTSEHARRIAQEVADGIFGAGASETQRLGALAVSTITRLADALDAVAPAPPPAPAPKARSRPAQAHERKTKT